ncbi:T9SS type B sorting domain-containing protein [Flavobacterium sp. LaA7.5]|nr:T9SS type B sorting domain-containing protein [Flavobacterium salilacus subsp. altitudinum]
MKYFTPLLFLFISFSALGQGEANNWYFGNNAGIQFLEDGTVVTLPGGAIQTNEGCSSISDPEGNLLFYTDGRNVWDKNHVIMPNGNYNGGTGLLGDPSSTQSGIIVPKKGDPNIYYIFTVDEPHHENANVYPNQFTGIYSDTNQGVPVADDGFNNGFNYSIVDLSITGTNGSIGDVTTRNVHLVTYDPDDTEEIKYQCSEKITAVKNGDNTGFWVITHFVNKFYAFEVTNDGVNETPVITQITPAIPTSGYRRNAIGYLKASPNGEKLAIAHNQIGSVEGGSVVNGSAYLYDFDNTTGIISNPVMIKNNINPYGIEFSAESKKLYMTFSVNADSGSITQYNLESANIAASEVVIAPLSSNSTALQLGPNGKIYRATFISSLDVINNPEEDGLDCNYVANGVSLSAGMQSTFGLPPFITSIFSAEIIAQNTCLGDVTEFEVNALGNFDNILWNFGDGTTSTETNPSHTYTAIGIYPVSADITRNGEVYNITNDITIHNVPVANTALTLTECDPDNNGVTIFNLTGNNSAILGTQSATGYDVKYFETQADADANIAAINATAYTNTSNPQTLYARVQNRNNTSCYATTSFQINVSNTPTFNDDSFSICDDAVDGDDINGQATFNLTEVTAALVQDSDDYTTLYYATQGNAEAETNPLPQNFYNTTPNSQVVFARVVNNTFADCFIIAPVTLIVNPLPPVVNNVALIQCDLGISPDGITQFNLEEANDFFTAGNPDLTMTYYPNDANATADTNNITGAYTNAENPQTITAKVTNTVTGCSRLLPLILQVNVNTTPAITLTHCDDDGVEDGLYLFDLTDAGLENGTDTIIYYASAIDALLEQNPVGADYTNTTPYEQSAYARIENNNDCTLIQEIQLLVYALPDIDIEDEAIVCNNTQEYILLSSGVTGTPPGFSYLWSTGAITNSIQVNEAGVYTVTVTNPNGCEKVRTITVSPSDVAIIDSVIVTDLVDNNTVMIMVSPTGGVNTTYLYSIDMPNGPFTESNFFENVEPGLHTVYVYDTNGCGIVEQDISVLAIPKFFTPNGDGINETWQIIGISAEIYANSRVYILDRYGKFLAGVNPGGIGWDGIYNGRKLPATDYWYVINLEDGRTVKGHFSLVR